VVKLVRHLPRIGRRSKVQTLA